MFFSCSFDDATLKALSAVFPFALVSETGHNSRECSTAPWEPSGFEEGQGGVTTDFTLWGTWFRYAFGVFSRQLGRGW